MRFGINIHRALQPYESIEKSLCFKEERTLTNNLTIQHDKVLYLIEDIEENRLLKRQRIDLHEYPDGSIELYYKDRKLNFSKLYDRVLPEVQSDIVGSNYKSGKKVEYINMLISNLREWLCSFV